MEISDQARGGEEVRRRQRRARDLFGVGGGAKLVEQDEGTRVGKAREAIEIDDVRGEAWKALPRWIARRRCRRGKQ